MDIRHLHVSRTPDEAEAYILHGKRNRAEYLTRWSLISILKGKIIGNLLYMRCLDRTHPEKLGGLAASFHSGQVVLYGSPVSHSST